MQNYIVRGDVTFSPIRSVLVDPVRDTSNRTLLLTVSLFVVSASVFTTIPRFESLFASPVHWLLHTGNHVLWLEYYAVGLVAGIALLTVHRQSLLRAWILAFAGAAGVGVNFGGIGLTGGQLAFPFRFLWAGSLGIAAALVVGTVGFLIGTEFRRHHRSRG